MTEPYAMIPLGHVRCGRTQALDDGWDAVPAAIVLDPAVLGPEALLGLDAFSHVEVLFVFHQVGEDDITPGARHPRGRADWPKVGILAQRGRNRPNRIGSTICAVVRVDGATLHVRGLDAIDGTPVIDVKPVLTGFLPRGQVVEPDWAREIMAAYW
jgi:tRNA (Thr-GGU) A37 N-methylase